MKRCPKCDFSFANFREVCDFDGTDLVHEPETLPVSPGVSALVAATQSPFLRLVKSPVFLIVLVLAGLISSALLIGYYDSASQSNSIAESQASPDSPDSNASQVPPAAPPAQPPARIRTPAPSTSRSEISKPKAAKDLSSARERSVKASRSRARLRSSPSIRDQQSRPEIALQSQPLQRQPRAKALQKESKESALQRDPKDKALQKESKESALQRDSKENANRKESKVTAMVKTTWRILKKPFKF